MTMLSNPDTSRGLTARMPAMTCACLSLLSPLKTSGHCSEAAANPVLDNWQRRAQKVRCAVSANESQPGFQLTPVA